MIKRLNTRLGNMQYISDIHLEYRNCMINLPIVSKNMVLAGDIGNPFKYNYEEYLRKCSYDYENTFVISGNHEYWNGNFNIQEIDYKIENIINKFDNVHFIKNKIIETDDAFIMGCVLWSNIYSSLNSVTGDNINIKYKNKLIDTNQLNKLHVDDVAWLKQSINKIRNTDKNVIIVTHFLPTYKLKHDMYNNPKNSLIYDRYYTNLESLICKPITNWIGGHSHCKLSINLNNVDLHINAFGYPNIKEYVENKVSCIQLKV